MGRARTIHPNSRPKRIYPESNGDARASKSEPDSWQLRLRLALRMENGAVFSARQCEQLAEALGWNDKPAEEAS